MEKEKITNDLKVGDKIEYIPGKVLKDGLIEAEVLKITKTYVKAKILNHMNEAFIGMEMTCNPSLIRKKVYKVTSF
jgi:hypothetical protein